MKRLLVWLVVLIVLVVPGVERAATGASPATVNGDFDGDGAADQATLVQHEPFVELTVKRAAAATPESFRFAVDASSQAAICSLPATLEVSPASCAGEDEPLPGCRNVQGKMDLSISDDACDAIHLYWNEEAQRMAWWRP